MIKTLTILVAVIVSGCGKGTNTIDPALLPMYNNFVSDAAAAGVDVSNNQGITVQFAQLEEQNSLGELIGECSDLGYGGGTVSIDTNFWTHSTPIAQKLLMYHELGHCLLDEGHSTDPNAIMYPIINNSENYAITGLQEQLDQLFANQGNN
jgi:hypothetical protein